MKELSNNKGQVASDSPLLADASVDLWEVDLDRDPGVIASHFNLLANDEKARADRYVFRRDRNRFVACRGTLRKILSGYTGVAPDQINISVGPFGKPFLSEGGEGLKFNVSHSHGAAIVAITRNRDLGVDIEMIDSSFEIFSVASSVFSTSGISRLRSLSSNLRAAAFFAGWTRKEALLKALGDGLSSSEEILSAVLAVNDIDSSSQVVANIENTKWTIRSFRIASGFQAALAVEGEVGTIGLRQWTGDDRKPFSVTALN